MADKPILYQPFQPPESGFCVLGARELAGTIYYKVPTRKPESSACPEGEWYRPNPECVVREVTVACKLHGEGRAVMRCPACDALLKFHHWLKTETLVPYKGDTASA